MLKRSDERGVVSILTVMFFVILLSILTVAFLRIMSDEQDQVIGDDLTKGALASAQSGVEDAKRALLFCKTATGVDKAECDSNLGLGATSCPGIFAGPTLKTSLGIGVTADGTVQVGGANGFEQRYTCLLVKRETKEVLGTTSSDEGSSNLVEIAMPAGQTFDSIKISWNKKGTGIGTDGPNVALPTNAAVNPTNLQVPNWKGPSPSDYPYPAVLRVQLLEYDPSANLTELAKRQLTYFLVPANAGTNSYAVGGPINNTLVSQTGSSLRPITRCVVAGIYSCELTLSGISNVDPAAGKRYFIRVSSKYRIANYKIELSNGGTQVNFNDVQPEIDATGVAGNSYRRLVTRVEYGTQGNYPVNGLTTGDMLCKAFYVTNGGTGGTSGGTNCTNGLAAP